MIQTFIDERSRTGRIVLRPNASWSWRANLWFLYGLAGLSCVIAFACLLDGAWLILPYLALEMIAVTVCVYQCVRQCYRQEVITVSELEVCVDTGFRRPIKHWQYHRLWAQYLVKKPSHPWRRTVVAIRSHGNELEIGSFLNDPDKSTLIAQLKRVVPA